MCVRTSEILNHYPVLIQFSGQGENFIAIATCSFRVLGLSAGNAFRLNVRTSLGRCLLHGHCVMCLFDVLRYLDVRIGFQPLHQFGQFGECQGIGFLSWD